MTKKHNFYDSKKWEGYANPKCAYIMDQPITHYFFFHKVNVLKEERFRKLCIAFGEKVRKDLITNPNICSIYEIDYNLTTEELSITYLEFESETSGECGTLIETTFKLYKSEKGR